MLIALMASELQPHQVRQFGRLGAALAVLHDKDLFRFGHESRERAPREPAHRLSERLTVAVGEC